MPNRCLLYYITDRTAFAEDEPTRRRRLLAKIAEAARAGVDYIQLREKNLTTRELESLAGEAVAILKKLTENRERKTALLINSRTDIALTAQAQGVHLRSQDIAPQAVRSIWKQCSQAEPTIAVSCHTPADVTQAASAEATFAVFAPVFEKNAVKAAGLEQLREACKASLPVLALGGVTTKNAHSCVTAGTAGIAAIRLFQENDIAEVIANLRR